MAQAKKKQRFFDVDMPIVGKDTQVYGYEIEDLDNKTISYDLTRLLRGKSVLLKLRVKVKDKKAIAEPTELIVLPYFIRRMMRKGTNYVEDSFSIDCKNAKIRVKPFLITRKKVSRSIRKALREKAREELSLYIKGKDSETLFDEVIKGKIQKTLSLQLKKVYPLSLCEIRMLKVEKTL